MVEEGRKQFSPTLPTDRDFVSHTHGYCCLVMTTDVCEYYRCCVRMSSFDIREWRQRHRARKARL